MIEVEFGGILSEKLMVLETTDIADGKVLFTVKVGKE